MWRRMEKGSGSLVLRRIGLDTTNYIPGGGGGCRRDDGSGHTIYKKDLALMIGGKMGPTWELGVSDGRFD